MVYQETWTLSPALPFNLAFTVWTLRRRKNNRIDNWDQGTYIRVFSLGDSVVKSRVTQTNTVLSVTLTGHTPLTNAKAVIARDLKKMLGLELNIQGFYDLARTDAKLKVLVAPFIGMKPPRFHSLFEAMLNAIACQQVSLDVGLLLLSRLAEQYGAEFVDEAGTQYAFPTPQDLASVPIADIKQLGFSYQKARTIQEIAQKFLTEQELFDDLENKTNEEIVSFLSSLRGIGRWSSDYVLLRGLGRLDVLPGDDVGAQKNLQQVLGLEKRPNYEEIHTMINRWQPYAGLVYFHLLLNKLQESNFHA